MNKALFGNTFACFDEPAPGDRVVISRPSRLPSTPPVENSKAVGGPAAADGQGVCTYASDNKFPRFELSMAWPDGYEGYPETMECQGWREVGLYISRCLDDGATVCSVVLSQ